MGLGGDRRIRLDREPLAQQGLDRSRSTQVVRADVKADEIADDRRLAFAKKLRLARPPLERSYEIPSGMCLSMQSRDNSSSFSDFVSHGLVVFPFNCP